MKTGEQIMSDLVTVIDERMHALGLSKEELAARADIDEPTFLNIMSLRESLDVEQLIRVAQVLGERAGELVKASRRDDLEDMREWSTRLEGNHKGLVGLDRALISAARDAGVPFYVERIERYNEDGERIGPELLCEPALAHAWERVSEKLRDLISEEVTRRVEER